MTDQLSPAAQAVLDAAFSRWMEIDDIHDGIPGEIAAAALRAAADRAIRGPEHYEGLGPDDYDNGWNEALGYIMSIAAELDPGQ